MTLDKEKGPDPEGFQDAALATPEPPKWVIPSLLPVGATILGGPSKSLKSVLATAMGLVVAELLAPRHQVWPPEWCKADRTGNVLHFPAETTAGGIHYLADEEMAGGRKWLTGRYFVWDEPMQAQLDTDEGQHRLRTGLYYYEPRLVILDPLRNFHSFDNENDSGPIVKLIMPLQKWALKHEAALLIVHHTSKPAQGQQEYKDDHLRGTGAFKGLMDGIIMVTPRDDANSSTLITTRFRRGGVEKRELTLGVHGRVYSEVLALDDERVLKLIEAGATMDQVAGQLRCSKTDLVDAYARLAKKGLIYKDEATKRWQLRK